MDYNTLKSETDRIKEAFRAMRDGGVPLDKARSLIALSVPETDVHWTIARTPDLWWDTQCFPLRVDVGLEFGEPIYQRSAAGVTLLNDAGNPKIDVVLIRSSAVADAEARQYLKTNGWIAELPASKNKYVTRQDPPYYYLTGGLAGVGTNEMAQFFEWVGDKRKFRLLDQFSIGPTMQWMAYSGEGARAIQQQPLDWVKSTKSQPPIRDNAWPDKWAEIFHLYVSASVADLAKKIVYMDYPRSGMQWYPADDPTDSARIQKWLIAHVGSADGAAKYTPGYINALNKVMNLTSGM